MPPETSRLRALLRRQPPASHITPDHSLWPRWSDFGDPRRFGESAEAEGLLQADCRVTESKVVDDDADPIKMVNAYGETRVALSERAASSEERELVTSIAQAEVRIAGAERRAGALGGEIAALDSRVDDATAARRDREAEWAALPARQRPSWELVATTIGASAAFVSFDIFVLRQALIYQPFEVWIQWTFAVIINLALLGVVHVLGWGWAALPHLARGEREESSGPSWRPHALLGLLATGSLLPVVAFVQLQQFRNSAIAQIAERGAAEAPAASGISIVEPNFYLGFQVMLFAGAVFAAYRFHAAEPGRLARTMIAGAARDEARARANAADVRARQEAAMAAAEEAMAAKVVAERARECARSYWAKDRDAELKATLAARNLLKTRYQAHASALEHRSPAARDQTLAAAAAAASASVIGAAGTAALAAIGLALPVALLVGAGAALAAGWATYVALRRGRRPGGTFAPGPLAGTELIPFSAAAPTPVESDGNTVAAGTESQ